MSTKKGAICDIGVVGLAVMGENLILNMASRGFTVAVFNRTTTKVTKFVEGRGAGKTLVGCMSPEEMVAALKKPRKIMFMIKAGPVVDMTIDKFLPLLDEGDILIDGGNSNFNDTNRRFAALEEKKILYCGAGVSGGEEGALKGPSIMPGGHKAAWDHVKPIFQAIAAKVVEGEGKEEKEVPCCEYIGEGGSGHYVKMVHNGIEYGDIQLICEAYSVLKQLLGCTNEQLATIFSEYNKGDLDSYLIEITRDIFGKKVEDDDDSEYTYVVDCIRDTAGQKGTGKWTGISALDLGMPVTLIAESVFARCLSAQKDERVLASQKLEGPAEGPAELLNTYTGPNNPKRQELINDIKDALYAAKIVSYAQGFVLIRAASDEYKWNVDLGSCALMWRGGCIIRSKFLGNIKAAFDKDANLRNLMMDDFFTAAIHKAQAGWRRICTLAISSGIPCPCFTSALSYYDGYRTARLPANLLQAQRDYFGAHQYQRLDKPGWHHTNWTGRGGTTASSTYSK